MKKSVMCLLFISLLLVSISLVVAENETINDSTDISPTDSSDNSKINDAYKCLKDAVDDQTCDDLSSKERIFALLAAGECKSEVIDDSTSDECWPKGNCDITTTAQAVLALDRTSFNTEEAEEWLIEKNDTTDDFNWYLQIESNSETGCDITYGDSTHHTTVLANKKVSSSAGNCLTVEAGREWWLKVTPNCYGDEIEISCDEDFSTSLLFKKKSSATFHVSEKTSSRSAEGTTTEKVESVCLKEGGECDYEGTLWGAMALESLGYEIKAFLPYLVVLAEDYEELIPEAFLYKITDKVEFKTAVLEKQESGEYWDESGNKFYDTAVALYPLKLESPSEKDSAMAWLLEVQGSDGCWNNGNILTTAFVLNSVWPKDLGVPDDPDDCDTEGYFCTSSIGCQDAGGSPLTEFSCPGSFVCCDEEPVLQTCSDLSGEICTSAETCSGGGSQKASGLSIGEECCVGGTCIVSTTGSECESNSGTCRSYGCNDNEEEGSYTCDSSGETCCIQEGGSSSAWIWWIIIILILIALAVLGIVFREKIKILALRIKTKFKKGKGEPQPQGGFGPGLVSPSSTIPGRRPLRRIMPRNQVPRRSMPPREVPKTKKPDELDSVLKKLKDMSK